MTVRLKMTHISSENYTSGIYPNVCSSSWHISHCRHISILNRWASVTLRVVWSKVSRIWPIGGGIRRINLLPEWQLSHSYVHPPRLTWPNLRAITMLGQCISWLIILKTKSPAGLESTPGSSSSWSHVPRQVPKTLTRHDITRLELCCLNFGILTSLALAWNGIVQMDSSDNDTLGWLPASGIILHKAWLPKSHMAHARCA